MFKRGFTLIELLVVIGVIGLLATIAIVSFSSITKQSRDAKRQADLESIRTALEQYQSSNGGYPTALTALSPYLSPIPVDPQTGNNYPYTPYTSGGVTCTTAPCATYIVSANLENSGTVQQNPYGIVPTPTATAAPTPTKIPIGGACSLNSQCVNGNCGDETPKRCCAAVADTCTSESQCCNYATNRSCNLTTQKCCKDAGQTCDANGKCCSGVCNGGICN